MSSRERPESEAREVRHQEQQAAAQKKMKIEGDGYEGGM